MNKQIGYFLVCVGLFFFSYSQAQEQEIADVSNSPSDIFYEQDILPVKFTFSLKDIKKNTNDSTYIDTNLDYQIKDGSWQALPLKLRSRGNFRLRYCYFPPLKLKIKKGDSKDTPFEEHKNLKMVLPCLIQNDNNDYVIKEYLIYKMFEIISPYHFKTRLLDIEFEADKGDKTKLHNLKGFLIEDDKNLAKRLYGRVYERSMHPLNQDPISSIRTALFQYMIGNSDFSQAYQHNAIVIYINKAMVPIPYDFDMCGFVNASYAAESIQVASVTDRKYRGFVRDKNIFEQVRKEFINNKHRLLELLDEHAPLFENPEEFNTAREYILSFYEIIVNNRRFKTEIIDQARTN
jgi:hypothetical protein